ncbi:MAG: 2-amino-4-hydroxy-6-hydroxymethyldihydropteridine diphosphokinase [Pseudonocardiaceae bacterium]|nr:2-amino-4-hydroxy-6-hydroxymethyldihydropteridine diphosphokinase [Pseudonocardiaceae bacterium]
MTGAVLSIGSNVGDRLGHLQGCVRGLGAAVRAASPVYATAPWGGVEQDDFLNAVLLVEDPAAGAEEWLRRARQQERAAQRTRGVRWGPRTLDVDVIDVAGMRSDAEHLTLPHPRAHQRAFVLVPWCDVAPDAVLPGHGTVADLVAALPATERDGVHRRDDLALAT